MKALMYHHIIGYHEYAPTICERHGCVVRIYSDADAAKEEELNARHGE